MNEGDSNFFSRWSRRKAEVREGGAASEPAPPTQPPPPLATVPTVADPAATQTAQPTALATPEAAVVPAPPPPTLADVATLTTQSDYARFVARDVAPDVKQAALKKLFTDPHFNVMDGLDTYIDDYGKPDPLPAGMLRQMVQSQLLGLFDHEKKAAAEDAAATAPAPEPAPEPTPEPAPEPTPSLAQAPQTEVDGHLPPPPDAASAKPDTTPAVGDNPSTIPQAQDP